MLVQQQKLIFNYESCNFRQNKKKPAIALIGQFVIFDLYVR